MTVMSVANRVSKDNSALRTFCETDMKNLRNSLSYNLGISEVLSWEI